MKKSKILLLLCLSFSAQILFAQQQLNNWYFGNNAGITFNSGSPLALTVGQLSDLYNAGSISDNNGNLLFYTDGQTVWNRNHAVMQNGAGLTTLSSDWFSFVLIIPKPQSTNFLIFTQANGSPVVYSEVDMGLDGGLGGVISGKKNITLSGGYVGGKMTAVRHANGQDFWLVVNELGGSFVAYQFANSGLVNTVYSNGVYGPYGYYYGALKASPDGSRIVMAGDDGFDGYDGYNLFYIMDFDNSSGLVSNAQNYYAESGATSFDVEFSPDGSKLYRTQFSFGHVFQYDLESGFPYEVIISGKIISSSPGLYGALQTGPDGKIYVAKDGSSYLGVINNPDDSLPGFNENTVFLNGMTSTRSLPEYPQSIYKPVCSTADPPEELANWPTPVGFILSWEEVQGSEGCKVRGRKLGETDFLSALAIEFQANEVFIPIAALEGGSTYEWQVRCTCSISPLAATPYSPSALFTVPVLKETFYPLKEIGLYPNPFEDKIKIESPPDQEFTAIEIYDFTGSRVYHLDKSANEYNVLLDLSFLDTGIYFLKLSNENVQLTQRIVKL